MFVRCSIVFALGLAAPLSARAGASRDDPTLVRGAEAVGAATEMRRPGVVVDRPTAACPDLPVGLGESLGYWATSDAPHDDGVAHHQELADRLLEYLRSTDVAAAQTFAGAILGPVAIVAPDPTLASQEPLQGPATAAAMSANRSAA